jgi:uncharacterized membrane protein
MMRFGQYSQTILWCFLPLLIAWLCVLIGPGAVFAQEVHQEFQERVRARVIEVVSEEDRVIMGTGATTTVQELRIELLDGVKAGEVAQLANDIVLLAPGDVIFVNRLEQIDGTEVLAFKDVERRPQLLYLGLLFIGLVVWFAGKHGARALLSLGLSLLAILYILVPALLAGYSPALVSLGVSAVILALTLFLTHGVQPRVVVAYAGTMLAVVLTCSLAWVWVAWMRLTGFADDAAVFLNFSTGGQLDFSGLLLGSIIIGLLGVLDDVSITQASVVQELRGANAALSARELYVRAVRVGRDHVGSLVNTLALAYVGAALPLVLLFSLSESSFLLSINQEIIAAEIIRIIIGSIGLILTVPFTTALAAWYFRDKEINEETVHHCGHRH